MFKITMKRIPISNGRDYVLVDDEDYEKLSKFSWCRSGRRNNFYVIRRNGGSGSYMRMHRFLLDAPDGMQVDHIDGNGLNNTKANLRICTRSQNLQNQRKLRKTSSKYKGVSYVPSRKKWLSSIRLNGKSMHIAICKSELEAARAYDATAKKLFGKFARPNGV